jgi:hypothetical protein
MPTLFLCRRNKVTAEMLHSFFQDSLLGPAPQRDLRNVLLYNAPTTAHTHFADTAVSNVHITE